ncbi:helix-turn-helix domain-containing protein [Roseivivax sp. CAU 1761]
MVDRWQALDLVKEVRRSLGLGEREIVVLQAHLSVLPKGPVRADGLLMSYAEVQGILSRAGCMCERRFRRGERELERAGLIARRLSANGRRFPVRDGEGRVVDAYGVDLRPLFLRLRELGELRDRLHREAAERAALRSRISARLAEVSRRVSAAAGALPQALAELAASVRQTLRRATTTLAEMRGIEATVEAACGAWEDDHAHAATADVSPGDGGQNVRHIEASGKDSRSSRPAPAAVAPENDELSWENCRVLPGLYPDPPRTPQALAALLIEFGGFLGLDRSRLLPLLEMLGPARMLILLDHVAEKVDRIRAPGAYLQALATRWREGETIADGRIPGRRAAAAG